MPQHEQYVKSAMLSFLVWGNPQNHHNVMTSWSVILASLDITNHRRCLDCALSYLANFRVKLNTLF